MEQTNEVSKKTERLMSLDALRGFDIFWIIGGGALFEALAKLTNWLLLYFMYKRKLFFKVLLITKHQLKHPCYKSQTMMNRRSTIVKIYHGCSLKPNI